MPLWTAFGSTVFGALHCLAWNYHFPTLAEHLLWRICSILMAALPILFIPLIVAWREQNSSDEFKKGSRGRKVTASIIIVFIALPYLLARLYILAEIFRGLAFLPPDTFSETWSGAFPIGGENSERFLRFRRATRKVCVARRSSRTSLREVRTPLGERRTRRAAYASHRALYPLTHPITLPI
jgi:hypothetical protein